MEEDDGFGLWIEGVAEAIDVTIRAQAADDPGTRWCLHGLGLRADGDFAVIADPDAGPLAPDKRPPRTGRDRTPDGAFSPMDMTPAASAPEGNGVPV